MTRPRAGRSAGHEDRFAVFLRGLVAGAFVGAIVAGSAVLRRTLHRPNLQGHVAALRITRDEGIAEPD